MSTLRNATEGKVLPELKDQMRWWILFLQMSNRIMPLPDLEERAPVWAISIWSDAAGGPWYLMVMELGV